MSDPLYFDYIVIGSGFGGSVAALRLREKGYRVCVIEKGRRFRAEDFPKTNWNLRRYLWLPRLGMRGPQGLTLLRDVLLLHGVGLGGGSLVYTGVLVEPPAAFFEAPVWRDLCDWPTELRPHFDTVRRTIGVSVTPHRTEPDVRIEELVRARGGDAVCRDVPMGITLGGPEDLGREAADPHDPVRRDCTLCGGCMVGCRYEAKNTLDRNYLHRAERLGAAIETETEVSRVEPLDGDLEGGRGYRVTTSQGARTARGVVFAARAMGTQALLQRCRETSALPRLSDRLGEEVRVNNEEILFVTTRRKDADHTHAPGAGARVQLAADTNALAVRFSKGSSFLSLLDVSFDRRASLVARARSRRPLVSAEAARDAGDALQAALGGANDRAHRDAERGRRVADPPRPRLVDAVPPRARERACRRAAGPASLPAVRTLAQEVAESTDGVVQRLLPSVLGITTTAHLFGGCIIGRGPADGVVDVDHRVFGYQNLYVCDGLVIPVNPGTAPSLTIAAMAERCMAKIPERPGGASPEVDTSPARRRSRAVDGRTPAAAAPRSRTRAVATSAPRARCC